jgi:hypothetical protein
LQSHVEAAAAPRAATPVSLTRYASADLAHTLERFNDPALLSNGKIVVFALDAIAERLGPRWGLRSEQVYDHTERVLDRQTGGVGFYARVSETDYLLVQPSLDRFAVQGLCLRALREILAHFLGNDAAAASGVFAVTRLSAAGIETQRIDLGAVEPFAQEPAGSPAEAAPQLRSPSQWTPFVAADGRALHVSCFLEPLYQLKSHRRIGFRIRRQVTDVHGRFDLGPAELLQLNRADLLRVDLATVSRGVERLRSGLLQERQPSLVIPVSMVSLSHLRGRNELAAAFREANALVHKGVICEISSVDAAAPQAVQDATALIRPFALLVVGQFDRLPYRLSAYHSAGLHGVALNCPADADEDRLARWAMSAIPAAKRIERSVLAYGAPSARVAAILSAAGATHVSLAG